LIGGSGLGAVMAEQTVGTVNVIDTPFGPPSAPIVETEWNGLPVYFLSRHGPGHLLNPSQAPYRANIFALKKLGVTHIIASGAVGSLREELKPRDLVIVDQIIDKTRRAGTFYDSAAVHVEFAEPFCPVLRRVLLEAGAFTTAAGAGSGVPSSGAEGGAVSSPEPAFSVHDGGCYVAMEGPAFSTRAESLMHRLWGGEVIGMTAMPEAKLAKEAEISYALIALVTDYDCWKQPAPVAAGEDGVAAVAKPDPFALLNEIIGNLTAATHNAIAAMKKAVELIAADPARLADCPAREALKLAIWSNKSQIAASEVERLAPLWLKYFRS
jgi:5'-methylthioadenosine phosphorylase